MPKPVQCKIVGGVSVLLGIGVLVASSVYLHESSYQKCYDYFLDIVLGDPFPSNFEHRSDSGGIRGGYNPPIIYDDAHHKPAGHVDRHDYHSNYDSNYGGPGGVHTSSGSGYGGQGHGGQGYGSYDPYHNDDGGLLGKRSECSGIIQKYRACAIIGIVASILQILISIVYAFGTKNTVKTLSLGWIVTHAMIVIALISAAAVVLAEQRLEPNYTKNYKGKFTSQGDKDELPEKKLAFGILALLDSFFVILMIIFVGLTFKKSDYDDPQDQPKTRKKFLES